MACLWLLWILRIWICFCWRRKENEAEKSSLLKDRLVQFEQWSHFSLQCHPANEVHIWQLKKWRSLLYYWNSISKAFLISLAFSCLWDWKVEITIVALRGNLLPVQVSHLKLNLDCFSRYFLGSGFTARVVFMLMYYCLLTPSGDRSNQVANFFLLKTTISLQVKASPSKHIFKRKYSKY